MTPATPNDFQDLVSIFLGIIGVLLPVLLLVALVAFVWGIVVFIYRSGDEKSHSEGRQFMIWGVVAIFVLVSMMGILKFFAEDLGIADNHFGAYFLLPISHETN
jgi:hypothetical protein